MKNNDWKDREWSNQCEDKDWGWFSKLAEDFPKTFGSLVRSPEGRVFDVSGKRENGEKFIYELKGRTKKYPDCFIEIKKYIRLKDKQEQGYGKPIYICFFNEGADAWVWDLTKPMTGTVKLNWLVKGHDEPVDRIGLQFRNATHYQIIDGRYSKVKNATYQFWNDFVEMKTKPQKEENYIEYEAAKIDLPA